MTALIIVIGGMALIMALLIGVSIVHLTRIEQLGMRISDAERTIENLRDAVREVNKQVMNNDINKPRTHWGSLKIRD